MSTHTSDEVESNKALKTSMSRQNDSIEGLEQLPSDYVPPPSDPSIFDDSLEKIKKNENETRGIEILDIDNNNEEGPALDPRIVHDDSLDKVREKEAAASISTPTSVQQTASTNVQTHVNVQQSRADVVHQGVNGSTNTDDFDNSNSSNTLEQGINPEEQSQRDTLGQLSQTQRRQGANNNNNTLGITNQGGRGRRDEQISSRSLVGRIANSLFPRIYHDSETLVEATLVDSIVMGEIVEARRVGFCARNWKGIGVAMVCILIVFAVLLSVSLATYHRRHSDMEMQMMYEPSAQPSPQPSFDLRPTFDIVRERGNVRCGVNNGTIAVSGGRILHLVSATLGI